jgi:hypothetical protein
MLLSASRLGVAERLSPKKKTEGERPEEKQ